MYHDGRGHEKVGEVFQAVTAQIPHTVQGAAQFCPEEHLCDLQEEHLCDLQEKHRGRYNNIRKNMICEIWPGSPAFQAPDLFS